MSHATSEPAPSSSTVQASTALPSGLAPGSDLLAEFPDYVAAQALVDRLSDHGFPVRHVRIIGTGIHSVEQVTGRMTTGRAAGYGAASGAWLGLLIGLLFGIFTVGLGWLFVLLWSVILGAVFGAVLGAVAHAATGGRRDFSSVTAMAATGYAVYVEAAYAEQARRILGRR